MSARPSPPRRPDKAQGWSHSLAAPWHAGRSPTLLPVQTPRYIYTHRHICVYIKIHIYIYWGFFHPELASGSFGWVIPAILSAEFCIISNILNFEQKVTGHIHFYDYTNKHLSFSPLPDKTSPLTPAGPEGAAHTIGKDSNSRDIPGAEGAGCRDRDRPRGQTQQRGMRYLGKGWGYKPATPSLGIDGLRLKI